ncbi:HDOD domain-containing protein [Pseudomonas lopnurensis]|uniref:HDOD domain-containing protein n=1 Tax=Pseudomonas lopnurensis TaxID=1477517 RepID=UPI0028ACDE6B|nr:HDOD domain-containing protein [Pseudomonas lopnurensis]
MTTTSPLPRTLSAWIKVLDDVCLPAFAEVHGKVRLALRDSGLSMHQIAEIIQTSPVLALRFIQEANRGIGNGQPAESLEVALSRIGLQRAETLLSRVPATKTCDIPVPLRQMVLISRHASQQANGLFGAPLARLRQDIHWGSLLFLAPAWALIYAYPHLLESWELRVLVKGESASRVERELLGVPLLELCLKLAEHWRLPDGIIQGYRLLSGNRRMLIKALHIARDNEHPLHQQQLIDADPELRRWLTQPNNTIVLANGLALSSHHSWSGVHSLRWQRLAGLYLQVPLDELQQQIHQQAVASARQFGRTDLWHPAQGLLWPTGSRFQSLRELPAPSAQDLVAWRTHCRQLLAEPTPFSSVLQLTATASQAFACGGMQRVLVMLVDRKQNRLVAQQCIGLVGDAAHLTLAPEQSQVLRRLLEKPAQLRLQPTNVAQFSALLPGRLKKLFAGKHLLLRSLGIDGRVLMLVIADQGGAAFTETTLQTFAKTAQCLERALGNFSRRER